LNKSTKEEMDDVVILAVNMMRDHSFADICKRLGRSYNSVQQAMRRRGILVSLVKFSYKKGKINAN
jgi:hypothetical protein